MRKINVYITFNGNCEEAFNFYRSVFGGDFQFIGRYKDVPPAERETFQPENEEKIMHVSLPISKETILMGCDSAEAYLPAEAPECNEGAKAGGSGTVVGDNISISIEIDSKEEASLLFAALSDGAKVKMPMAQTFWGAYFGVLTDKFGINWLINCDASENGPGELSTTNS